MPRGLRLAEERAVLRRVVSHPLAVPVAVRPRSLFRLRSLCVPCAGCNRFTGSVISKIWHPSSKAIGGNEAIPCDRKVRQKSILSPPGPTGGSWKLAAAGFTRRRKRGLSARPTPARRPGRCFCRPRLLRASRLRLPARIPALRRRGRL